MATILVDVDGVVCDLHKPWLERYNADYKDELTVDKIIEWDISKFVVKECGKNIFDYLNGGQLYADAPFIVDSHWGVESLRNLGHKIIFVSSGFHYQKYEWLKKHSFIESESELVLTADKSLVRGDLLLDDYSKNLMDFHSGGILFDRPWNQEHKGNHRVFSWQEATELVKELYG